MKYEILETAPHSDYVDLVFVFDSRGKVRARVWDGGHSISSDQGLSIHSAENKYVTTIVNIIKYHVFGDDIE